MSELSEIDINNLNNENRIDNITEQKYLELAQDMKKIVEEKDQEVNKVKNELNDYKFVLYKVFGIMSFVDDLLNEYSNDDYTDTERVMAQNLGYCINQVKLLLNIH